MATLLLGTASAAQTGRDVGVGTVPTEVWTQEGFDPAQSAGLFVGIRNFEDKSDFAEVPYAVDDAVDLAYLFAVDLGLIAPSKVVLSLAGEPRKEASKLRLRELLGAGASRGGPGVTGATPILRDVRSQAKATGPRGLFVLAVATHGFSVQGGDFVVASDSLKSLISDTGIRLGAVFDTVATAMAPRRLVLLDACRERFARSLQGDSVSAMSPSFAAEIGRASGQVVLTGATPGGFAYDDPDRGNGVFTAAVVDGLSGQAPADERGYVTVTTLAEFVNDRVAEWVREHRPEHLGKSRGIEWRVAGDAAWLPLAVDMRRRQAVANFEDRRKAALARLAENVDAAAGPIDAKMYAVVAEKLLAADPGAPGRFVLEVFTEIETLDGTKLTRRSFAYFFGKNRGRFVGSEAQPLLPPPDPGAATATRTVISAMPPASPQPGEGWQEPKIGMHFRYVPGGTFKMGSPEDEEGRDDDETLHSVELTRGYWLGETEVTQAQWREVMGTEPSHFKSCGDHCPVEQVSWYDAVTFANELSAKAGLPPCYDLGCKGTPGDESYACTKAERTDLGCEGYRLPTEAEWERAARAGHDTALYTGEMTIKGKNNSPELGLVAWYGGNSGVEYEGGLDCSGWPEKEEEATTCGTQKAAGKRSNDWGLHDMLGNVWEWVEDAAEWEGRVKTDAYRNGVKDPVSTSGAYRVLRGGSWDYHARYCRAASRDALPPGSRWRGVGFRLLRMGR